MDIVKVTSILTLFFAFNFTKDKDSLKLEDSLYDDKFFRWTKDTFRHGETLTAIYNEHRIDVFNTEKVRDRLLGNQDKVSSDTNKENFACKFGVVRDLILSIHAEEMEDDEIIEFDKRNKKKDEQDNTKKQK
jgi:hypothetical protein